MLRSGVDDQRVGAGGDDRALIVQAEQPAAQLAGAGDGVVDIGQGDIGGRARDQIRIAVGQDDLSAALQRNAVWRSPRAAWSSRHR